MDCRDHCGACCIAPGISQPYYGMPNGKPAGERCIHLDANLRCEIFADPRRPPVCSQFKAEELFCGQNAEQAMSIMLAMEGLSE